jgi:hypothetical protein
MYKNLHRKKNMMGLRSPEIFFGFFLISWEKNHKRSINFLLCMYECIRIHTHAHTRFMYPWDRHVEGVSGDQEDDVERAEASSLYARKTGTNSRKCTINLLSKVYNHFLRTFVLEAFGDIRGFWTWVQ